MRIAVTRPEEDAAPLQAKLEALGHQVIAAPLIAIRPRTGILVPDRNWQAIAVTSANGIRMLPGNAKLKSIRMLTVGPQSLKAALDAGYRAEAHGGDVHGLAAFIQADFKPANGPILYLSGAETAGDLKAQLRDAGFECQRLVLYDAVPADSLGLIGDALYNGRLDGVMLYSPRTARIWRGLVEKFLPDGKARIPVHLCLSRNVAAVLPEAWPKAIAETPDEAAMMALLEQMQ